MSAVVGATEVADRDAGRFRRFLASDHVAGWAFILPSVALILLFGLFPIVWGLVLSMQKASLLSPVRPFIGLDNYRAIPKDPLTRKAALNTLIYTMLFVPISIVARAVRGDGPQPEDPADPLLPAGGVHPRGGLDDRHRDHVPVAARQGLRPRELGAGQGGAGAVRVLRLAVAGAAVAGRS